MVAPLLPVLDFAVLPPGQLVHDRYLYLPSFGAALITALALSKLATGAKATSAFGLPVRLLVPTLAIVVLCCYATADAASYWIDDYTLFQHAYELTPTNIVARVNYAIAIANHGDYVNAMPLLDGVLYEDPNNWLANYNLGRVFYNMGLNRAARNRFEQVERLYPTMPENYLQLGLVEMKMNNPEQAEANMRKLLDTWREAHMPIIHIQHCSAEPNSPLRPGNAGNDIKEIVAPLPGEPVLRKKVNSAFIGTDLESRLKRDDVRSVVIVGLTTDHCVSTTARMAGNLGFETYVVSDATATFDRTGSDGRRYKADEIHAVNLASISGEFAQIVETTDLLRKAS
jgi:nicotinamidase-related amidase